MTVAENSGGVVAALPSTMEGSASLSAVLDDQQVVLRVLGGEKDLFEQLVHRHEESVYRHLLGMVRLHEEAEDLAQETFVLAYRGLGSYRRDLPFRPWILRIATNAALSRLRRRQPEMTSLEDLNACGEPADSATPGPAERMEWREATQRLEDEVRRLPAELAALFHLRYHEELSVERIADVLGRKSNAVAVALHRLREKLRRVVFTPDDKGGPPS